MLVRRESERKRVRKRKRETVNKRTERSRCSLRRRVELPTSSVPPFPPFNSRSIWTLKKDHGTGDMPEKTNREQ